MTFETETKNTSTSTNNEHRAKILYDATIQFCAQQGRTRVSGADQYKKLFYSFVDDIDHKTKKLIFVQWMFGLIRCQGDRLCNVETAFVVTVDVAALLIEVSH